MYNDNIKMLSDTLEICEKGVYTLGNAQKKLKLTAEEMRAVRVFLPDEIAALKGSAPAAARSFTTCENADSFTVARKRQTLCSRFDNDVLVLNLANAVHPGGGVRRGTVAQEEDLCRKSSLLLSLESPEAAAYYNYNKSLKTFMGSHAIIITPKVEIIKGENGNLLDETAVVAVMTCAAPNIYNGIENLTEAEYEKMVYDRILGMLRCAHSLKYTHLVLGAFGCGAFANDAKLVARLFSEALDAAAKEGIFFNTIDFAVLSRSKSQYNFKTFSAYFALPYKTPEEKNRDKIRGSMLGGAAGDALGYAVEFSSLRTICEEYGRDGITAYEIDPSTGKALVSDDTQMALFTANGLLYGETCSRLRGIGAAPHVYIEMAYLDWLFTQEHSFSEKDTHAHSISWLMDVSELYSQRAPGLTCLNTLRAIQSRTIADNVDFKHPRNNSKGCGGIMRTAPLALFYRASGDIEQVDIESALVSAVTHGHSLGYIPSAVLNHILCRILSPISSKIALTDIICEAKETACRLFAGDAHLGTLCGLIDEALLLAQNDASDTDNIRRLGEGRVAEETLAIALYCAVRYENDFSRGLIAAVNHDGDSDSTGAVAGNILGAIHGYSAIDKKWKEHLELSDIILEMADDLSSACRTIETDGNWEEKYINAHRPTAVFFWHEYEENGYLSNWYESPFTVDGIEYPHMEQFIMAQKAKLFCDKESYIAILQADSPAVCKALGREVKNFDSSVWNAHRSAVLVEGLKAKFTQNPALAEKLLSTGDRLLAEASPYDKIFGIGLSAKDAAITPPEKWEGKNLQGKALMEVRKALRK